MCIFNNKRKTVAQNTEEKKEEATEITVFNELKRRVDLTRRSRIKASERLRSKHEFYEKVTYFYSLIIIALSVWYISGANDNLTKILLIASLSLTFSTMFLGAKNYKERASNFEFNYQQLNVLLNKIQRLEANKAGITQSSLKELHREYEKLIIDKENHINIDYMKCKPEHEEKYCFRIFWHNVFEYSTRFVVSVIPLLILIYFLIKYGAPLK